MHYCVSPRLKRKKHRPEMNFFPTGSEFFPDWKLYFPLPEMKQNEKTPTAEGGITRNPLTGSRKIYVPGKLYV